MSVGALNPVPGHRESAPIATAPGSLAFRAVLFVLFLACALAIFLFGSNYYKAYPTNGNAVYAAALSAVFLGAALALKASKTLAKYWPIAYAFFTATVVNLVSAVFGGYNGAVARALGLSTGGNEFLAVAKVYEAALVVVPVLVLIRLSGADLGSVLVRRGDLKWGLGMGALVLFNFATSALIFHSAGYAPAALGSAVLWGTVFSFSNGLLEELWFRSLFLKRLTPLIGATGAILLTAVWFAIIHLLGVTYMPAITMPIFLVNTLTLGIGCGLLMHKTGSIWGAVLIHAAADLYLFVAMLAVK